MRLFINACVVAFVASANDVLDIALTSKSLSRFMLILVHRRIDLEVAENGITRITDVYNASPASIDCKSKRVSVLGDMLKLGPSKFKFHGLMIQNSWDHHFNVVAHIGPWFLTAAEIVDCFEEIKLVCNYLVRGHIILVNDSSERQLGVNLDIKLIFPITLCCSMVREDASTESSLMSLNFWKMRFIHAHILGSRYILDIRHAAPLPNGFLISNLSLVMMEGAIVICG
nr:uncharacterized protein LOC104107749 isoform X1 [Nicotiana tomentosiformis]